MIQGNSSVQPYLKTSIHTVQCKSTRGCYNELPHWCWCKMAEKVKKSVPVDFMKLAFILFVMTPGSQTIGNIAVYDSAKQNLVI